MERHIANANPRSVIILLLVAAATALGWSASKAETPETVTLYVSVEQDGKAVGGLSARNFRVWEDGEAQPVNRAEPSGRASVVLLVENNLVSWHFLNDAHSAMRGFLQAAPEGHQYALVTYGRSPTVEQGLTEEIDKIAQAYANARRSAWRETDTYDAVYRVLEEMETLPGPAVLIVVGSGFDSFSQHTFGQLKRKAESVNVMIWGIATGSELRQSDPPFLESLTGVDLERGEMLLRMLSSTSGGKTFCPSCEADYQDSMRNTTESLDKLYTVVYERAGPPADRFRKLKVEGFRLDADRRRDFKVRVRQGWRF